MSGVMPPTFSSSAGVRKKSARLAIRNNRLRQLPVHARQTHQHIQTRRIDIDQSGQIFVIAGCDFVRKLDKVVLA